MSARRRPLQSDPAEIGKFRWALTLETPTRTSNGAGGKTVSYATVDTVRGRLALEDDSEGPVGDRVRGARKGHVEILYRKAVTTAMRLTLGSRVFNITAVPGLDECLKTGRQLLAVEERVG